MGLYVSIDTMLAVVRMVKTTINLDDELWKKFSIKVIEDYGGRKKTDIFEALADAFVNSPNKTIEKALEDWLRNQKSKQKSLKQ
jgi:predicted transcriptional regulator